jgi:CTP:molybdopterin cytidylyltransferase MocA
MTGSLPTQAIILAAGEGRRLAPLTDSLPKPLVPFFGRPLLDWAVRAVVEAGVTRIGINAFHLADAVVRHVEAVLAPRYPAVTFTLSREPQLLGTGGGVRRLAELGFLAPERGPAGGRRPAGHPRRALGRRPPHRDGARCDRVR